MKLTRFLMTMSIPSLAMLTVSCVGDKTTQAGAERPGWILTFHDEFDKRRYDTDKWDPHYRNNPAMPACYEVKDGILPSADGKGYPRVALGQQGPCFLGGNAEDVSEFAQQYGRFEIRARCAKGGGLNSGFWLAPLDKDYFKLKSDGGIRTSESEAMEIDIFEQLGREPMANNFTVHLGRSYQEGHKSESKHVNFPFDMTQDFHVFALEWSQGTLVWYVDDKEVLRSDKAPTTPFFIRLSFYLGDDPWRGEVPPDMTYPQGL